MKEIVGRRVELLVENRELLHKAFFLENGLMTVVAGAVFAEKNKTADPEFVKECRDLLKKKKGPFSEIRGNNELLISAKMALSGSPEQYLEDIVGIYNKLQRGKFFGSRHGVLAASSICDAKKANDTERVLEKTTAIIKGMKAVHPFLTSDEDTGFAVLLAMTDKSVEQILEEVEESYQYLKKDFVFHDNAVYSLAQVLTTYAGDSKEKCRFALEIFEAFKSAGFKYGKDHELPSLGILVNLGPEIGEIVAEVIEVAEALKEHKGFGMLDMSKQTRLMISAMIVSSAFGEDNTVANASVASGALSLLIAEQAAVMAVIASTTAAAATSSR